MRPILFRGKTADGKWLYGSLMNWKSGPCILTETTDDNGEQYPVIAETVGQCVGNHDKYGEPIYEGDILAHDGDFELTHSGVVQYALSMFGVNWDYFKNRDPEWDEGRLYGAWGQKHNLRRIDDGFARELKVIGNIHDKEGV